jgi:hypothetical protein
MRPKKARKKVIAGTNFAGLKEDEERGKIAIVWR